MTVPSIMQKALNQLILGQSLSNQEAKLIMEMIMEGDASPAQIGALLTALRIKGESVEEVTGFAQGMREKVKRVETVNIGLLDTCGTGGDGMHTFNISTASAIVAAAGGVRVAKHGNRAMSSRSGSADVLEALGVNIAIEQEQAALCLQKIGICFMFAQIYHPSMKYAAAPRKELGFRTVFNLLGPLTNPAGADRQLLGVYDRTKTDLMAKVLNQLGVVKALVVSSYDGLDEISVSASTKITQLDNGSITTFDISPEDLGLRSYDVSELMGGDAYVNAEIIRNVLSGAHGAHRDVVLANAGACFYISGIASTLKEGIQHAIRAIDTGAAAETLSKLVSTTKEFSHVS